MSRSTQRRRTGGDQARFWGDSRVVPPDADAIRLARTPTAALTSLGPPPLGPSTQAARPYLQAVYDKAVGLAGALAATADLLDTTPEDDGA